MPSLHLNWFFPVLEGVLFGFLALVLHEVGHAIVALAIGVKVKRFGLHWKGVYLLREAGPPAKNLVISAAGPVTNTVLILTWYWWPVFGLANLCFALFNILPLESSDGERMLKCWRQMREARLSAQAD